MSPRRVSPSGSLQRQESLNTATAEATTHRFLEPPNRRQAMAFLMSGGEERDQCKVQGSVPQDLPILPYMEGAMDLATVS